MNQDNGGIIGKINTPTTSVASGVWTLDSQFESQSSSIWPLAFPQTTFTNSCRFNDDSSDYLSRTPGSESNRKTFTFSAWVKRSEIGTATSQRNCIFSAGTANENKIEIMFYGDKFQFVEKQSDAIKLNLQTNRLFRDVSAWYHLVVAVDTTQSTSSDRIKIYVNSTQISDFASSTYPSQDHTTYINDDRIHNIGRRGYSDYYSFDGYMTEIILVDGQQLTPTSFGATNPVTNIWEPIAYTGTYGTNGFKLNFSDSSNLGDDTSGNGNDYTVGNLTSIDQSSDTCSNNFATLNGVSNPPNGYDLSEGNLKASQSGSSFIRTYIASSIAPSQGKWYWESKLITSGGSDRTSIGICSTEENIGTGTTIPQNEWSLCTGTSRIRIRENGSTTEVDSFYTVPSANDIFMYALDLDNTKFYFGINGNWFNYNTGQTGGDPTSGSGYVTNSTNIIKGNMSLYIRIEAGAVSTTFTNEINFGSSPFSISSGNADANGHGNFEYAVPSGYFALCTKNLAEHG